MTLKEFQKYLERDGGCYHCGTTEALSPNHRANRGMGGSKKRDVPSNIVVLCSELNDQIERLVFYRDLALNFGWKLNTWQDPKETPVYDMQKKQWFLLNDDFGRIVINSKGTE